MFDYFNNFYIKLQFGSAFVITEVIFILGLFVLLNSIPKDKKEWLKVCLSLPCAWIVSLILSSFIYWLSGNAYNREIVYPLILALYAVKICRYSPYCRVIMCCNFYAMFLMSLGLSEAISFIAGSNNVVTIIIFGICLILFSLYLKLFSPEKFNNIPLVCVALPIIYLIIAYILEIFLVSLDAIELSRQAHILIDSAVTLLLIICYLLIYFINKETDKKLKLEVDNTRIEQEMQLLQFSKANLEELRLIRHDIKNQYACVKLLLEEKKSDKAIEYFYGLENSFSPAFYLDTGNEDVNTAINLELIKAKSNGIQLDVKCTIPKTLNIKAADLTGLLTNLIDNAIEADISYGITEDIIVRMNKDGEYLFLKVANSLPEGIDLQTIDFNSSSKSDKVYHGLGTKIIRKIVNKYNGTIQYAQEDNKITVSVMLVA